MMTTEPATHPALADAGELEQHRAALARHCRRMLGSSAEADDAVQETMMRAWRARDRFEDGSSLSTWLYHIATNVCFDALRRRRRHAVAVDFGPGATHSAARVEASGDGPAELAERSDNIRLAFVVALRRLPPTQRVAVILHDVFRWKANEVAALLDTSAPAVNSALQRARATLQERREPAADLGDADQELLQRLVAAHEQADVEAAVALMREDVRVTMPPHPWLYDGLDAVRPLLETGLTEPGEWRVLLTRANRMPAFACYLRPRDEAEFTAFKLDVVRLRDGAIAEITTFNRDVFASFGLPAMLDR
jgi:RNA polymerase sigma-70 factor (ECF subfamily)